MDELVFFLSVGYGRGHPPMLRKERRQAKTQTKPLPFLFIIFEMESLICFVGVGMETNQN